MGDGGKLGGGGGGGVNGGEFKQGGKRRGV